MRTVFFDVDTQADFMLPAGALYVPGAERILPTVERLNHFAGDRKIPLISTTDAHAENDAEFRTWPAHCVAGTWGQLKPSRTLLEPRVSVPSRRGSYPIAGAQQILLEKQALDCFTNPNLPAILDALDAERFVVYGVVTEFCVRMAALGLLGRSRRVEIVTDAIRTLAEGDGTRTLTEFTSAGGLLVTAAQVLAE